ncbi:MAG TPA: hypothetical protein VIP57_09260 [Candidatus Dormibacteraeota bacterium]
MIFDEPWRADSADIRVLRSIARNAPRTPLRSSGGRTPAKGEFCRSSIAAALGDVSVSRIASDPD